MEKELDCGVVLPEELTLVSHGEKILRDGIVLHSYSYVRGENVPVRVWVAVLSPGKGEIAVQTAPWGTTRTVGEHMEAARKRGKKPVLATNADFFHLAAGTLTPYGTQIVDGVVIYEPHTRERYGGLWFGITEEGRPVIGDCEDYFSQYQGKLRQGVGGGVLLMKDGALCVEPSEGYGPRTWVGYAPDGTVALAVADGRQPEWSKGVSLADQARILQDLNVGITDAINLDGGGSTAMAVSDGDGLRLINRVCVDPERPVADVLMIVEK